jgi:hypothetical protein
MITKEMLLGFDARLLGFKLKWQYRALEKEPPASMIKEVIELQALCNELQAALKIEVARNSIL